MTSSIASHIAERVQGEVSGDGSTPLTGFSPSDQARAGDLAFAHTSEHFVSAEQSAAASILVSGSFSTARKVVIRAPSARVAVA